MKVKRIWFKRIFFLENFLIIENRVSIAGYHKKLTAMNGDKYSDLFTKVIINMEKAIDKYSDLLQIYIFLDIYS